MSRPTKETGSRRNRLVIFRLTEPEHDHLSEQAERAGMTVNDLARSLARKGRQKLVVQTYRHCDPAFLKRLDQIGQHLKEMLANAKMFGHVSPVIAPLCDTIERLIMEALEEHDGS